MYAINTTFSCIIVIKELPFLVCVINHYVVGKKTLTTNGFSRISAHLLRSLFYSSMGSSDKFNTLLGNQLHTASLYISVAAIH